MSIPTIPRDQVAEFATNDMSEGKEYSTHEQDRPTCPHCGYALNDDDMGSGFCEISLWNMAPQEDTATVTCPQCDKEYWVRGGYRPHYTSAFAEELL